MASLLRMVLTMASAIVLLSACSWTQQASTPTARAAPALFELGPTMDRQGWLEMQRKRNFAPYVNDLLDAPANQEIRLVTVSPGLVGPGTRMISVLLPGEKQVHYQLRWFGGDKPGRFYWYGDKPSDRKQHFSSSTEVDVDPSSWASLVRYGDKVFGEIRVDGQLYRLDYVGTGQQVLIKIDSSKNALAQTCVRVEDPDPSASVHPVVQQQTGQPTAISSIRVMMMSTVEARASFSRRPVDYPSLSDIMEDHLIFANRQLQDSGVEIKYEFAGYVESIASEKGKTPSAVLNLIRMSGSDVYTQMQAARERLRADLVLTAIVDPTVFGRYYMANRKETGFSTWNVLGDYLDMGHVLGHNIGGEHYWKPGDPDFFDPPYQHGYLLPGGNARTIMTDYEDCRNCTRLNYYSNPRKQWQGIPLGTAERHDVVRRLNERRAAVEAFYP
ncbi:hypothetical protein [Pseudomonas mosselii]|uniref:hypothetical protein n=1 Tax=Pseudomonas mosselii TaxID=78327 RepID=UPI001F4C3C8C|nr:hypothetical protein [Pseudomonas mosselii]MCH7417357.1 hypothetical protein [Pseudomonas mosselii]